MAAAKDIVRHIGQARHIGIVIHQQPDGDAVGSAVALAEGLRQQGKVVSVTCAQQPSVVFEKIVGQTHFVTHLPAKVDLLIVLDCGECHRSGYAQQLQKMNCPVLVIDHHARGDMAKFAQHYHLEPTAAATAEIIFDYLNELRCVITPTIATALLMGIYTDTGAFQHATTTSRTLTISSRLIRYGANLYEISHTFLQTLTPAKKRLWGQILAGIQINRLGVVTAIVTQKALLEAKASAEDVSGLANSLALIAEARAALVLVELKDGWRGTLRTRHTSVDVSRLAQFFGGRGQKKAAGFLATKTIFSGKIKR